MGQSDGDNLAIVLSVIEGTGFDTRKYAIIIKANLSGNILETEKTFAGDLTASFKNNLIWSTNKDAIKRMKEDNQPIKLECFYELSESRRESIGFVLIPLRTIPFWNSRKMGMMKPHWYKLHGVPQDNLTHKPELLLSVTIGDKDHILNNHEKILVQNESSRSTTENEEPEVGILKSNASLHVSKLGENEIVIVGIENMEQYEFVVDINLRYIDHCDHLDEKIDLIYTLFNQHKVEICKYSEDGQFHIDQIISVKFKTSLSDLIVYFRNIFSLPIVLCLYNTHDIKGYTQLNFGDSLSTLPASIESFQEIFSAEDFTYQFDSYSTVIFPISEDIESKIHYNFSLKYIPYNSNKPTSPTSLLLPYTTLNSPGFNKIATVSAAASNASFYDQMNEKEIINLENLNEKHTEDPATPMTSTIIPKTFAYTLSLLDCSFNKRPFPGIWQLSLQHPAADSSLTLRNLEISDIVVDQISFEDMHLRLCFTTHPDQLFDLIKSKPCILTLKGPRGVNASAELDNHNILTQEKTKGIVLLENEQNEQMAMAHISVRTEELGLNFNTDATLKARQQQKYQQYANVFPDEDLAYKMIEELEEWKQVQRKEFLAELKRHEIAHLTQLSNEWQRKRREEELRLHKKMEHCDRLTQTLEEAHNMFKERNRSDVEYEHTLLKTKSDLERCYSKKIDSLNGKILQMEKENFIKQKNDEQILKEIEIERNQLKNENKKLRARLKMLENQVKIGNTDGSAQEQISELKEYVNLVSDELEKMRKSKMMYKEKWAHIVREVQKIKYKNSSDFSNDDEDYRRLNELIKSARTDISNE